MRAISLSVGRFWASWRRRRRHNYATALLSDPGGMMPAMDAVTSLITAVGTVVAIAVSLFFLRQGQLDRRTLTEERRRGQASRVTCWCDWNADSPSSDFDQPPVHAIYVCNTSDQAVYQVFVN